MLKSINKRTAGFIVIGLNLFTILIEMLVMMNIVPYSMIGGGRMTSYEAACMMAIISILSLCVLTLIVCIESGLIKYYKLRTLIRILLWLYVVYTGMNFILNLLATTWFEKAVFGLLCVIQFILLLRLATDKQILNNKIN